MSDTRPSLTVVRAVAVLLALYVFPAVGQDASTSAPAPSAATAGLRATIGQQRSICVDGKPFFPIGIYHVWPPEKLAEAKALGFNTVHTYRGEGSNDKDNAASPEEMLAYLNAADKLDLKVFMGLPRFQTVKSDTQRLEARVKLLRAHPALLAWYLFDEPDTAKPIVPAALVQASADLIRKHDSKHPLVLVLPWLQLPERRKYHTDHPEYLSIPDILMTDVYPREPNRADLSLVAREITVARQLVKDTKTVWNAVQLHGKGPGGDGYGLQEPNWGELRNMTYQSLAAGAKGITFWSYAGSQFNLAKSPSGLKNAKRIAAELQAMTPVLLSDEPKSPPVSVEKADGLLSRVFVYDGNAYLMVVNLEPSKPLIMTATAVGGKLPVEVKLFFQGRTVKTADGKLTEQIEANGVRVYEIPLKEYKALAGEESRDIAIWPEDSMVKVFRDAAPPKAPGPAVQVEAARNEVVSGQAVFWCARDAMSLKVRAGELALEGGRGTIPAPRVRFVGYILVKDGKEPGFQLRHRPARYPDPLTEEESIDVPARTAQPVWLTMKVPRDAAPGVYTGRIEVEAGVGGAAARAGLTVKVRVYPATLPDEQTLQVSNWSYLYAPWVANLFGVEKPWSAEHWTLLRNAARNMAAHRQNVIKVDPMNLAEFTPGADGRLRTDFSRFDQLVQIFVDEGVVGRIEGADLATRQPGAPGQDIFRNPFVVRVKTIEGGKVVERLAPPESSEAEKFCAWYLPALVAHLREKKWLDRYMQHVADEVLNPQIPTYRAVAALVRRHAAGVKIVEAIFETKEDLLGIVDVWVPKTIFWEPGFFGGRQKAGEEVWLYTCCDPNGRRDLNRFIEYPLTRTRLLHWLNYATGTTGYLHWGWDYVKNYRPDAVTFNWGPGDEWLIYPGKGGVLDSIRSEAMLEGIQDYELLKILARQDRAAADRICRLLVRSREDFQDGAAELRAARTELLKECGK